MRKSAKVLIILAYSFLLLGVIAVFANAIMQWNNMYQHYQGVPFAFIVKEFPRALSYSFGNGGWVPFTAFGGLFVILGIIAHILMNKDLKRGAHFTKGGMFLFVISYVPYAVPFIIIFILWAILKFIDIMLSLFTGKEHPLASAIDFLAESAGFKKKTKTTAAANSGGEVVIAMDSRGNKRALEFVESSQDYCPDSPYYLQYYRRFKDDLGYYWRSYGESDTYVPEKDIPGTSTYVG